MPLVNDAEILRRYRDGQSMRRIFQETDASYQRIRRIVLAAGDQIRGQKLNADYTLTPKERLRVRRLYEDEGKTLSETAKRVKRSRSSVTRALEDMKVPIRGRGRPGRDQELRDRAICEAIDEGLTFAQVADQFGMTRQRAHQIYHERKEPTYG